MNRLWCYSYILNSKWILLTLLAVFQMIQIFVKSNREQNIGIVQLPPCKTEMSEKTNASLIVNRNLSEQFIDSPFKEHFFHDGFQCVISNLFSPVFRITNCDDHFIFLLFFASEKSDESKTLNFHHSSSSKTENQRMNNV